MTVGKGNGKIKAATARRKMVASRMVGMYRLLEEQHDTERFNSMRDYANLVTGDTAWRHFKEYLYEELEEHVTSEKAMMRIVANSKLETGSLKDLLWGEVTEIPKQAIAIRIGTVFEHAIRRYLMREQQDLSVELASPMRDYTGRTIITDYLTRDGNKINFGELKYNLNLDTEKCDKVVEKLDLVNVFLKKHFKNEEVDVIVSLVSLRYPYCKDIPKLKPSLESVRDTYIVGYREFFNTIGLNVTERMWRNLHKNVGEEIAVSFRKYKNA